MRPVDDEILPVYFASGEPTDHAHPRSVVHHLGLWHPTLSIWIVRRIPGGSHTLLFQERHRSQVAWPGKLDTTTAGHVVASEEDPLREIEEELGVRPQWKDLIFLGVRRFDDTDSYHIIDRELQETYLWINELPIDAYKLQPDEVAAIVEIELSQARRLLRGDRETVSAVRHETDKAPKKTQVRIEMVVPDRGDGYSKLLTAATRLVSGAADAAPIDGWLPHPISRRQVEEE